MPWAATANGVRLVSQDAFAGARGEAFVATADNPSAIYYNVAGITQLDGLNVRGGIYTLYLDTKFTPPSGAPNSGTTYQDSDHWAAAPQFFGTYTLKEAPVSFGLGVYAPYGASITWPDDTGFRAVATKGSLTYVRMNPVIALKLAPNLSIGGGVFADYGKIDLEQGLRPTASPLANYFAFKGHGWSMGYNLGILWQPLEQLSFGVTFRRSETDMRMKGQTELEQRPLPHLYPAISIPAHADFSFPETAVFGVSYRPTPDWNFEFDADYTDWQTFGTVTIVQEQPAPFPVQQNIPVRLNWQDSWMYEFGVTRYLANGWHVSAGYVFNENSVPDSYYTPIVADMDRHFIGVGAGKKGKRIDFDVTYQFGYGPPHAVSGSTASSTPGQFAGQNADGTYKFMSHAVLVSAGVHF